MSSFEIKVESTSGCERTIVATVPADIVKKRLDEGYRDLNRQVQFPGFRKGKAPRNMLEKRFGSDIANDVAQTLADEAVREAVSEHDLQLLGQAELKDLPEIKSGDAAVITLHAEVRPEFELPEYKGLEIERDEPVVTDADIYAVLKSEQFHRSELNKVDRKSKKGDAVRADVVITSGDETIANHPGGLLDAGYEYIAGVKTDAKAAIGVVEGDEKEFSVTLPDTVPQEELRGKEATLKFTVIEVLEVEGPSFEEVAKELEFESEDAWKDDVRDRIRAQRDREIDSKVEEQLLIQVADSADFELPERFSKRRAAEMVQRQAYRLYQMGYPEDKVREHIESHSGDENLDKVKLELKRAFVIDAISRKERVVVTEDEIKREAQKLAAQIGRDADEVYEEMEQRGALSGLREELKTGKVLKMLREKAKYKEA